MTMLEVTADPEECHLSLDGRKVFTGLAAEREPVGVPAAWRAWPQLISRPCPESQWVLPCSSMREVGVAPYRTLIRRP